MQSTGHTSTQAVSLVPIHGSQMIYAIALIIVQACDPALAALFTPPHPEVGWYEVCTTPEPLEVVIGAGERPAEIEAVDPADAFGAAGPYPRSVVARLYAGI